jgi:hypothetical protein
MTHGALHSTSLEDAVKDPAAAAPVDNTIS